MVALPLTTKISSETSLQEELEAEEAPFGDGYMAVSERMNANRQVWRVVWANVSSADAKTLRDFFRTNRRQALIQWTPPDDATEYDFRITGNLSYEFNGGDARTVSFSLKQVFDNV